MSKFSENIQYEPKRQNRFIIEFPKEFGLEEWHVNTATKPKYSGIKWEDMEVTFKDPIGPSTSHALYKLIKLIEELKRIIPSELPLFFYKIVSLDPTGVPVETWEIGVREVLSISFGQDLDYASDEMQTPKVIFRPMYCVLKPQ
jgi:hypothetical protein